MSEYRTIVGLEVHVELATKTKTFCSCANDGIGALPNTLTCPVCLGLPGAIPSINKKALQLTIKTGLLLNAKISEYTMFERKNFFSPDMPKGYQLCQLSKPICSSGFVELNSGKKIEINRVHLEEDSGKIIHDAECSLIDYNRSGAPILEIVTNPNEMTIGEVIEFLNTLRHILIMGGVSKCRMEIGEFRFDVNVSVARDNELLGTRIELKNLTSTKMLISAVAYEVSRQSFVLMQGNDVVQETRVWSEEFQKTYPIRLKENIGDYRHFPDPDLNFIKITPTDVANLYAELPESYFSRVVRYKEMGFNDEQIELLTSDKSISDFMDQTCALTENKQEVYHWISGEMLRVFKEFNKQDFDKIIEPSEMATIVDMVMSHQITRTNAKILFDNVVSTGKTALQIAKENELLGVASKEDIHQIVSHILADNPQLVEDYRRDQDNVVNHIIGATIDISNGKANAVDVINILSEIINE